MSFIHTKINNYLPDSISQKEECDYKIGSIQLNEENMKDLYKFLSNKEQQTYFSEKNVPKKILFVSEINKILRKQEKYKLFKKEVTKNYFISSSQLKDFKKELLKLREKLIERKLKFDEAIEESKKSDFYKDETRFLHGKCINFLKSEFEYYKKLSEPILYAFEKENIDLAEEVNNAVEKYKKNNKIFQESK